MKSSYQPSLFLHGSKALFTLFLFFTLHSFALNAKPSSDREDLIDHLIKAKKKITPLHTKKKKAQGGDWLSIIKERGQSFEEYLLAEPNLPTAVQNKIVIQPIGKIQKLYPELIPFVEEYLNCYFSLMIKTYDSLPLEIIPKKYTRENFGQLQLETRFINTTILRPKITTKTFCMIGLTEVDLWPGDQMNFVFGSAYLKKRIGIWSVNRLQNGTSSKANDSTFLIRTLKVASHEIGHMFTILHCTAYECNMNGSNSLEETDRAPSYLCPECMSKICYAGQIKPKDRYRKLAQFFKKYGFKDLALFYQKSIIYLD